MSSCGLVDVCKASVLLFIFATLCHSSLADESMLEQRLNEPIPGTQVVDLTSGLGSYIVRLDVDPLKIGSEAAKQLVDEAIARSNGAVRSQSIYLHAMVGFSAWMTEQGAADLARSPGIANVQPDRWLALDGADLDETNPNEPSPWNLRRISEPDGLAPEYDPCGADGTGVTAVIIDTGIQTQQTLFSGRIREAISFAGSPGGEDVRGHGTHVAGTVAGDHVGVAPGCEIVALRVADDQGQLTNGAVLAAVDWLADPVNITVPAVVNMSLGGPINSDPNAYFYSMLTLTKLGYVMVVSAGNDARPTNWQEPAAYLNAISVGAINIYEQPSAFTNYGSFVDILAPGVGILSADWAHPDGGLMFDSGTSQAAPCVSGVVALFLERHVTAEQIEQEPDLIGSRAHISMVRSASDAIVDATDPMFVCPDGTASLSGAANLLVQACDAVGGLECDGDVIWSGDTIPVMLGDGVERIPGSFECIRTVRNTKGPVSLTVNTMAISGLLKDSPDPLTTLSIEDVATGEVLWVSVPDSWEYVEDIYDWSMDRMVTSTSRAGLRIVWEGNDSVDYTGYGYVMTANLAGACPADLGDDGQVGILDLLSVLEGWGVCQSGSPCAADIDGDGMVGANDLLFVVNGWGDCEPFTIPGFIRDCDGNQVPKGFLGDEFLDDGVRQFRMSPVLDPDELTTVSLNCPDLDWDTLDGNPYALSPLDPRVGACANLDGTCSQVTFGECDGAGGQFWGRGVSCADVGGLFDQANPLCDDVASHLYAWPMTDSTILYGGYATYRQLVEPGLYSISGLRWSQTEAKSVSRTRSNISTFSRSVLGRPHSAEVNFGITVYYKDGGDPDLLVRAAETEVVVGPDGVCVYTIADELVSGDREIHAIRIVNQPTGLQTQSSLYFPSKMTAAMVPEGSDAPGTEKSVDGGRTWYPTADAGERAIQMSICVTP